VGVLKISVAFRGVPIVFMIRTGPRELLSNGVGEQAIYLWMLELKKECK
jgi:hypothetical protein